MDQQATEARRDELRAERLGGRAPAPAVRDVAGQRFSWSFNLDDGTFRCRRCGAAVADSSSELYQHMAVVERPTREAVPLGLRYPGSERFVLRAFFCPACGHQVDVQVNRTGEPPVIAYEPLEH